MRAVGETAHSAVRVLPRAWCLGAEPAALAAHNRGMAIILGWDPGRGARLVPLFRDARAAIQTEGRGSTPWPVGSESSDSPLRPGARVHLMLQGPVRGVVGCGRVVAAPFLSLADTRPGPLVPHVMVSWTALLPEEARITTTELEVRAPGLDWDRLVAPVTVLDGATAARLERVWLAPHPAARPGHQRHAAADRLARTGRTSRHPDSGAPEPATGQARLSRSAAAL